VFDTKGNCACAGGEIFSGSAFILKEVGKTHLFLCFVFASLRMPFAPVEFSS